MSHQLVSHNPDLKRLVEHGYAVAFVSGHLVVRDIPYLDSHRELRLGALVTTLQYLDQFRVQQVNHQVFFAGGVPYETDGTPIRNLGGGPTALHLGPAGADVVVERSFSNKPLTTGRFADLFEKIDSYVTIISGPAMALFDTSPLTFRGRLDETEASVFNFQDSLTSRAQIGELAAKVAQDVVAVIGLGGTGSYLLDFLVKTPVAAIRAFDFDVYHVHTAFRSPGRLLTAELGAKKADIYRDRYSSFRGELSIVDTAIDSTSAPLLAGVSFAFVCVDSGPARNDIFKLLIDLEIPFIDSGLGLDKARGSIGGLLRTTHFSVAAAAQTLSAQYAPLVDVDDNVYRTNIQIAELNALAAAFAMIRYKQLRGFYADEISEPNLLFEIADLKTVSG